MPYKQGVVGSIPTSPTLRQRHLQRQTAGASFLCKHDFNTKGFFKASGRGLFLTLNIQIIIDNSVQ